MRKSKLAKKGICTNRPIGALKLFGLCVLLGMLSACASFNHSDFGSTEQFSSVTNGQLSIEFKKSSAMDLTHLEFDVQYSESNEYIAQSSSMSLVESDSSEFDVYQSDLAVEVGLNDVVNVTLRFQIDGAEYVHSKTATVDEMTATVRFEIYEGKSLCSGEDELLSVYRRITMVSDTEAQVDVAIVPLESEVELDISDYTVEVAFFESGERIAVEKLAVASELSYTFVVDTELTEYSHVITLEKNDNCQLIYIPLTFTMDEIVEEVSSEASMVIEGVVTPFTGNFDLFDYAKSGDGTKGQVDFDMTVNAYDMSQETLLASDQFDFELAVSGVTVDEAQSGDGSSESVELSSDSITVVTDGNSFSVSITFPSGIRAGNVKFKTTITPKDGAGSPAVVEKTASFILLSSSYVEVEITPSDDVQFKLKMYGPGGSTYATDGEIEVFHSEDGVSTLVETLTVDESKEVTISLSLSWLKATWDLGGTIHFKYTKPTNTSIVTGRTLREILVDASSTTGITDAENITSIYSFLEALGSDATLRLNATLQVL